MKKIISFALAISLAMGLSATASSNLHYEPISWGYTVRAAEVTEISGNLVTFNIYQFSEGVDIFEHTFDAGNIDISELSNSTPQNLKPPKRVQKLPKHQRK